MIAKQANQGSSGNGINFVQGSSIGVSVQGAINTDTARAVVDSTTINDVTSSAFHFEPSSGATVIYGPGNNSAGFNNGIVSGGALTPLTQH